MFRRESVFRSCESFVGEQFIQSRGRLFARDVSPFVFVGVEASDVGLKPRAVLKKIGDLRVQPRLDLKVAPLTKAQQIPPRAVGFITIKVMNSKDAPFRYDFTLTALRDAQRVSSSHVVVRNDRNLSVPTECEWADVRASVITRRPLPFAVLAGLVAMTTSDAAMTGLGAHAVADLAPTGRIVVLDVKPVSHLLLSFSRTLSRICSTDSSGEKPKRYAQSASFAAMLLMIELLS